MSIFIRTIIVFSFLEASVLGSGGHLLSCPMGYRVEGMASYNRLEIKEQGFMVCMQCSMDAKGTLEFCIDKDFTKDKTSAHVESGTEFQKFGSSEFKIERHQVCGSNIRGH